METEQETEAEQETDSTTSALPTATHCLVPIGAVAQLLPFLQGNNSKMANELADILRAARPIRVEADTEGSNGGQG